MLLLFSCSVMSEFATKWTVAHQAFQSLTISWSLPKFMSIALVIPSSHPTLWCSLLLLPSIFPSSRDLSRESAVHIRWPKYCSFSISPSSEYLCWSPLRLTALISLLSKGLSGVFSSTTIRKYLFFRAQPSLGSYFFNVCSSSKNFASSRKSG